MLFRSHEAEREFSDQIEESKEHAEQFRKVLALAEKRFAALKKVEERHANAYKNVLEQNVTGFQKMVQEVQ